MRPFDAETESRLSVVEQVRLFVEESSITGLLVTGSLAWGKGYAVNKQSDIDFYLVAKTKSDFLESIDMVDFLPADTISVVSNMLKTAGSSIDAISIKTPIGKYHGSVYFFTENNLIDIAKRINNSQSSFFTNLRPIDEPQTKVYFGMNGNKFQFTTDIDRFHTGDALWVRKDPAILVQSRVLYCSIFTSHLLSGDIYVDKNSAIEKAKKTVLECIKNSLSKDKHRAYQEYLNFTPRIERMNERTKVKLFNEVWSQG